MFAKALVILASMSAALAFPQITNPVATSSFAGDSSATVTWSDNGTPPLLAQFGVASISIYVGNVNQQTHLQTLSPGIDISKQSELAFTPNSTIGEDSNQYFIRMQSLNITDTATKFPAMAFSAKFTLTGMKGHFNKTVLDQIAGVSTARPSSTGVPLANASPTITTSISKVLSSATPSATKAASQSASGAESIVFHGSWIGFLLCAFLGVTIL